MDDNKNILLKILSADSLDQIDNKYSETISFYRECSELIDKTYFVLGRKRELKFTTQSTKYGRIDTTAISSTSKI